MNNERVAGIAAREKVVLENWYVIHVRDRQSWNAEPLSYDKWYLQDGQRLLLDYYREVAAERAALLAVVEVAGAWVDAYPHYRAAMKNIEEGLPITEAQDLEITWYQESRAKLFAQVVEWREG